jgi:DNA-binding SARP family transcriptional activator
MEVSPLTGLPVNSPARLWVRLLGTPFVILDGSGLIIPRRQVRALLYRLAAELQPVSRTQLQFLFWSDTPQTRASLNLSHLLSHLKRLLPDHAMVLCSQDQVCLNPICCVSDSADLLQIIRLPENFHQIGKLTYGPFLEGFFLPRAPEFESWAQMFGWHLNQAYLSLLNDLLEKACQQHDIHKIIDLAQCYLQIDPLEETVTYRLMLAFAIQGRYGAAIKQYLSLVHILQDELGISPGVDCQTLFAEIQAIRCS